MQRDKEQTFNNRCVYLYDKRQTLDNIYLLVIFFVMLKTLLMLSFSYSLGFLHRVVKVFRCFGGPYYFHLQGH